jgi:hypothetical protein
MLARVRVLARQVTAPIVMHGADRLSVLHWELGIQPQHLTLTPQPVASDLVAWEAHRMTPLTRTRWLSMRNAASADGVTLVVISAFRDWEEQAEILRRYLRWGQAVSLAMRTVAPPGYSEHHTGRALDLACPECLPGDGDFAETDAFRWLSARAQEFGFAMSYPMGNPFGVRFEPWHWCASLDESTSRITASL